MKIKAVITGATGMVGEGVLLNSLANENIESIVVIGRRPCGITHPKLKEIIHNDFFNLIPIKEELKGYNACFFCLGVSSVGMKNEDYIKTTYDLTMHFGKVLSEINPDMTFCYVSGKGTDSSEKGKIHWARVKGKTENDLRKLPFKGEYNFRPGFIKPVDGQKNVKKIFRLVLKTYPFFKALFPEAGCTMEEIGKAMIKVSISGYPKNILDNRDIEKAAALL
ncbi:MAG: epimerase [Methanococcaceae archaeon]